MNVQSGAKHKRRLGNWIEAFFTYTDNMPSPEIFRKWAAISLIAGAMERRHWVNTGFGQVLYPNLYVILVAPPGVGKTVLTSQVWGFWHELNPDGDENGFHVASSSLTSASIVDDLREAERKIIRLETGESVEYNSLAICSNELGVLIPEYDTAFMSKLTDIYDNLPYSERRRGKDINFKIPHPQLNLLAATTPSYLTGLLPEGAWDQGFLSRTILVYSGETNIRDLFGETMAKLSLRKDMIHDLRQIFAGWGEIIFAPAAKEMIQNWHRAGGPPAPEHPRLMNYNTRRTAHLLKLCMVACVAAGPELVVTEEIFATALDWLLEIELFLPDIFKSLVLNGDGKAIDECWYHVYKLYLKENAPIAEHRIIHFLQERVPVHSVARILEVMTRANILKESMEKGVGKAYTPKARKG